METLVISTDFGARQAYIAVAKSSEWETCACVNCDEAIRLDRENRIDVLIMDAFAENGLCELRRIRDSGVVAPAIFISVGHVGVDEAGELGICAVLSKPPDIAEMKRALVKAWDDRADMRILVRFLESYGA